VKNVEINGYCKVSFKSILLPRSIRWWKLSWQHNFEKGVGFFFWGGGDVVRMKFSDMVTSRFSFRCDVENLWKICMNVKCSRTVTP